MITDKTYIWLLFFVACNIFSLWGKTIDADIANVPCQEYFAENDENKRYFLIGDGEKIQAPEEGFNLVIVIPGGGGGAGFNPFIRQIYKYSLSDEYLAAQLVAVKWTPEQKIVWPTKNAKVQGQKFSTEEFVEAVIKDIESKYKINERHIFTLAWSSSGPAAYAISLQKEKSVTGSYIAMSFFEPEIFGSLENAAGHCYFLAHSPDDKIYPMQMAKKANEMLSKAGAKTRIVGYQGGHGWHGNVFGRFQWGFGWLERSTEDPNSREESAQSRSRQNQRLKFPLVDGFETGDTVPAGWHKRPEVEGVKHIWDKKTAFEGKASLCLKKTVDRLYPIGLWFKAFNHDGKSQKLQVSAQVKAEHVTKAIIDIQFYTTQRDLLGHKWAAYIGPKEPTEPPADHDWKQYGSTVPIHEDTKIIVIALQIYGPGTVWFDELKVEYAEPDGEK